MSRNGLIRQLYANAFRCDVNHGQTIVCDEHVALVRSLTEERPVRLMLTFDQGAHASGWWRNSDYDRCMHLSLSWPRRIGGPEAPTDKEVRAWAKAFFGRDVVKTWTEPSASVFDIHGRLPGVVHVRLFLDKDNRPIQPEGEVYTLKPWADGTSPEKVFR